MLANCLTQDAADQLRHDCSDRVRTFVFDVTNVDAIRAAHLEIEQLVGDNGVLHENMASCVSFTDVTHMQCGLGEV